MHIFYFARTLVISSNVLYTNKLKFLNFALRHQ
uniref:Uncharacterized protein n=1 Tax=Lepeophtheirus salmonis TaxID=72036 RepID=A0A0K2V398_LEPSM